MQQFILCIINLFISETECRIRIFQFQYQYIYLMDPRQEKFLMKNSTLVLNYGQLKIIYDKLFNSILKMESYLPLVKKKFYSTQN
ncbi:unnamed protein product (macronuclear) [Paramecium tetraurelia]|uniref:Uncharacterized protein n=1 Tax=Paramecium tetraurelia TaxID=5888 RepID=A0BH60_PARTE|nr:uncharacterized protein GSPATT00028912001 [Paramecium tetraurelia]CAK57877.1 unnamed protein product [Paramecium tetraurelia]|eukprot:XP_001425275.1 hypothetical protein (macronuclear) [Paramecium tetraurelia strain d4-2]